MYSLGALLKAPAKYRVPADAFIYGLLVWFMKVAFSA
jgi:hypothetical protein